jgi:thioredoxin reductase
MQPAVAADGRPSPPGDYPVVVVGSGPGAIQTSYSLTRLGIRHAVISADEVAGGMFRRFPFFQRLLSWTKPHSGADTTARAFEWYDWNSLLADEPEHRSTMPRLMDGTSSFPARPEMERNLQVFAEATGVAVRYGCRWETTRREPDGTFVLGTSDGEYRCRYPIFAVGVAEPFKPSTPGFDAVPHYVDTRPAETYKDKRLVIIGKQNSGFELATGLLQWCRRIVLVSPRPARPSVDLHSLAGVRARYVLPFEDAMVGGGVFLLDASVERVERAAEEWHVHTRTSDGGTPFVLDADEVIAATGFVAPLQDLPALGVTTFGQARLPAQTPYWESATVPGIFFTGTIGQGAAGLRKYGHPANSGAVHGARYNARIVARTVAERLGATIPRPEFARERLTDHLLEAATSAPELWNQKAYLAAVVSIDADGAVRDESIHPLQDFVDRDDPATQVAMTVETDDRGRIYPFVYLRRGGDLAQHALDPHPLNVYTGDAHRAQLDGILASSLV